MKKGITKILSACVFAFVVFLAAEHRVRQQ